MNWILQIFRFFYIMDKALPSEGRSGGGNKPVEPSFNSDGGTGLDPWG
jgi:hypothetical protein